MFNEHYGLETATLNGSKVRTSRILKLPKYFKGTNVCGFHKYTNNQGEWFTSLYDEDERDIDGSYAPFRYSEGEIVAIAQKYKDVRNNIGDIINGKSIKSNAGWNNKMFVKAEFMPHQIQITNIKLERLQDISDEDCIKEGIIKGDFTDTWDEYYYDIYGDCRDQCHKTFKTPKEAFADLIDKVSGKGTWRKNPWVVVYYYQLIK